MEICSPSITWQTSSWDVKAVARIPLQPSVCEGMKWLRLLFHLHGHDDGADEGVYDREPCFQQYHRRFRRISLLVAFSPLLLGQRGSVARVCAPALLRLTAVHFHISAVKMGLCRVEHLIKVWASDRRLKENGCHQRLSRTKHRLGVRFVVGWTLSLCLNKQTQIFAHSC